MLINPLRDTRTAKKTSSSPLTSGTLWTYTGGIRIVAIYGIVRTQIQVQATTCRLTVKNDALTTENLCANRDISGDTVGGLYHITNAAATALNFHASGSDDNSNALAVPIATICTTSGVIGVLFGAASTGAIDWYLLWEALSADAAVV